ncbi:WD40 repeat domain-containing protein, partial [Sphaerisporangium aureirubrum]
TASGDGTARIWDPATGTLLHTLTGHNSTVNALAYSPDGTQLTTASGDGTARIWDPATGTLLHTLTGHTDWVLALAYSGDGTQLTTASNDRTARIWDPATGTLLHTLTGHTDTVNALAYSPDGTHLTTASGDGTTRLVRLGALTDIHNSRCKDTILIGLPAEGWAAIYGTDRYRLHGDSAGRFWWVSGTCRFEPGELDGYTVERLPIEPTPAPSDK